MVKISYVALQKKYAGKIVALTNREDKIVAASKNLMSLFRKIKQVGYDKKNLVFVGPVEKYGTVAVY